MHFFSFFLLFTLVLASCGDSVEVPVSTEPILPENPMIYVSVFTHAEQENGAETPDFVEDEEAFWEQRALVIEFAEMLHEKGVGYDYQSDWTFLEAALKYDEGTEETNGKNFLRYLAEDLDVSIDPHNHTGQSAYNYADVAYLIEALGVEPTGVVGGFLALPVESSMVETLWEPVEGNVYDYTWQAEILWGGGTEGHVGDDALRISGVWRPSGADTFTAHDPEAPLAVVGNYVSTWENLDVLLDAQKEGLLEDGKMYTISIDAHQKNLSEEFIQEFAEQIDAHKAYVDEGRLVWATIPEVYQAWTVLYDEMPSQYFYLGEDTWEEARLEDRSSGSFGGRSGGGRESQCGNGVCEFNERRLNTCSLDCL